MNRRLKVKSLLGAILVARFLSGAALAEEASKSDYAIPAELKPVWTWKNGYSAEEAQSFRRAYLPDSGVTANDIGSWAASRLSEIGPSAIVHRYGPVSEFETQTMSEIADVTVSPLVYVGLALSESDPGQFGVEGGKHMNCPPL